MRTKEEVLMNVFKQNCTERIYKFQKVVNHDLIYKAMQEYAEEYHREELLKYSLNIYSWIIKNTPKKDSQKNFYQ